MENIPYTAEKHPETGMYNAKLGVWLFLASEVMLFGGLFSAYVLLRMGNETWPSGASMLNVPLGALNTFILEASGITMALAWASLKFKDFPKFKLYQGLTILLAIVFLAIKSYEYFAHFAHHEFPSSNIFLALYFTMTGVHALHIIGGIIVNSYFWGPGSRMWKSDPERFTNRIEVAGLYWHFVDIVWIFLFPVLYLL